MTMFQTHLAGSYTAKTRNFDGTFDVSCVPCNIIGESDKSYLIMILLPVKGHAMRDTMKVRKHNVRIKDASAANTGHARYDYSEAYWNI